MARPVVASTTVNEQTTASTTLTVNMPETRPEGDLFACFAFKDDDPAWTSIPSNWTEIFQIDQGTAGPRLGLWMWEGGPTEPTSYALGQDNEIAASVVLRITGSDAASPLDTFGTDTGSSANADAPDVTVGVPNTLVLRACAVDTDAVTATQATERAKGGGGAAGDVGYGVSTDDGPASGGTGTKQFTHSTDTWVTATVTIREFVAFSASNLSDVEFPVQNSFLGPFEI